MLLIYPYTCTKCLSLKHIHQITRTLLRREQGIFYFGSQSIHSNPQASGLNRHLLLLSLASKNCSAGILVDTNQLVDVASARSAHETRVPIPTTDISALRCRRKELRRSSRRGLCCHLTGAAPMASSDRTPSCSRGSATAAAAAQKLEIEKQRPPGLELLDGGHEIGEFFGILQRKFAVWRGCHVDALVRAR